MIGFCLMLSPGTAEDPPRRFIPNSDFFELMRCLAAATAMPETERRDLEAIFARGARQSAALDSD